jgi:hypothetical protein
MVMKANQISNYIISLAQNNPEAKMNVAAAFMVRATAKLPLVADAK